MSNDFKNIASSLEETHRNKFKKLEQKLRLVNASQFKNFRESLKSKNLRADMYMLGNKSPLVLHQPDSLYYEFDEDDNLNLISSPYEPFYLSDIECREFVPAVFNSYDVIGEFLEDNYFHFNGPLQIISPDINERQVRGPIRNSPFDNILVNQVQGVPSSDELDNPLFKITSFSLYDKTKPIFFRHPQSVNQKGIYGHN